MPDKNGTMPGQPGYMTPEEEAKYAVDPKTDVGAPRGNPTDSHSGIPLYGKTPQEAIDGDVRAMYGDYSGAAPIRLLDINGNEVKQPGAGSQSSYDPDGVRAGADYYDPTTKKRYVAQHNTVGTITASGDVAGIGGRFTYLDPDSAAGKAEIANRLASFRGESDAYVDPRAKVNKQISTYMQDALDKQQYESLKKFQNPQTPLDVTRANLANAQQQALLNQLQASRRQGSIAQLQGATAFGRNIAQAGVGAGRGALASRAALGNLARGQSNVAGAVGTGAGKEQAAISGALAQQLAGMRGSNLATNQAANQALLQQKQNALGNYVARTGAFQSGEQSRKSQEIQNLLRAYRMAGNDEAQKQALEQRIMGAIGSTVSFIASAQ